MSVEAITVPAYKRRLILAGSSFFGLGYLPWAPGTWGTVGALALWWLLAPLSLPLFVAATVVISLFAIWISGRAERLYGDHDVGHIVIDEVAGLLCTAVGIPFQWPYVLVVFIVFRALDMWKPWPIRWFDRHVEGGLGVVIDDVVAGVIGCGLVHLARVWLP